MHPTADTMAVICFELAGRRVMAGVSLPPLTAGLKMRPAFFHGEYLVGMLVLGAAAAVLIPSAVALWWWQHPPRSPALSAAIYLLIAIPCLVMWLSVPDSNLIAGLSFAALLPWSFIYFMAGILLEVEISGWVMLPGILVNAALIYGAATLAGRRS